MAVDFSTKATDIDTQIEPAARLIEPVSRQGEIDALNQIGRGIGVGARTLATWMQNKGNMDANKRLADFSLRLNQLQDAEAQGVNPSEIRIRGRSLLQQELANNPNAEEDTLKRYSTWLNQSGYQKIETPAQQQAAIEQKQIEAAVTNGFISANDVTNPQKVQKAVEDLESFQGTVRQLETDVKKINYESSKLELGSKKRNELEAQRQEVATNGLMKIGNASLPYWRTQYENIKDAAAKASTEQERQQIIKQGIIQLEQDYAQRTAALTGDTLSIDQSKIDQILKPTRNLIDTYKKELAGEYDTESFKRQVDNAQAQSELMVLNRMSPKAKAMVAVSKLFGQAASVVLQGPAAAEVANLFAQMDAASATNPDGSPNINKPGDVINGGTDDEKGSRSYLDSIKKILKLETDGKIDKEASVELNNQFKSVFKSVDVFGNASQSAQEFQPVIDFLADPTVGAYLAAGGKVPPEFTSRAQQVIQDGYQAQVIPLLKSELDQTYARSMKEVTPGGNLTVRFGDIVEPTMDTGRFGFKLKAGVEPSRENAAAIKVMNTSPFVKVMNKLIMSNAHMQGNTDYKKSYEQIGPAIFGTTEGEQKRSDAKDTKGGALDLGDLVASNNPDVVAEVLNARAFRSETDKSPSAEEDRNIFRDYSNKIDTENSRGYEPDISNLRPELVAKVTELQNSFGAKLPVVSGFRDRTRNAKAGGAKGSQHIHGNAVDIDVSDLGRTQRIALIKQARAMGFTGVGIYANSIHLDLGGKRVWGPSYHKDSIPSWASAALED